MIKIAGVVLIIVAVGFYTVKGQELVNSDQQVISVAETALVELKKVQAEIEDLHPYLAQSHPIAILEGDQLFIFDLDSRNNEYRFQKKVAVPFPMTKGIRAAFPLSVNDGKPTCIVSREIFDEADGFVTFFHEFMHCHQSNTCEYKLKGTLNIAERAAKTKNYSWELNHEFPYQDSVFVKYYSKFLDALSNNDHETVSACRIHLKEYLSQIDFEYMVWQEWKEGFARLIENKILAKYDLAINNYGLEKPYDRIVFYSGGARFIEYLTRQNEKLFLNIETLFGRMYDHPTGSN